MLREAFGVSEPHPPGEAEREAQGLHHKGEAIFDTTITIAYKDFSLLLSGFHFRRHPRPPLRPEGGVQPGHGDVWVRR